MEKITAGFESHIVPVLDKDGKPTGTYTDTSAPGMVIINLPRDKHYLQIDFPCGFWLVDNYGDRVHKSANSWVIDVFKLLPARYQDKPKYKLFLEYNPAELGGREYLINTTDLDLASVSGVNGQVVTVSEESGAMVQILRQLRELNAKITATAGIQIVHLMTEEPVEKAKKDYLHKVGTVTLTDGTRIDNALVVDVQQEGNDVFFIVQYESGEKQKVRAYGYGDSFAVDRAATTEKAGEIAELERLEEEERKRVEEELKAEQERIRQQQEAEEKRRKEEEYNRKRNHWVHYGYGVVMYPNGEYQGGQSPYGNVSCLPYRTRSGTTSAAVLDIQRNDLGWLAVNGKDRVNPVSVKLPVTSTPVYQYI